jgi:hypothetical protein
MSQRHPHKRSQRVRDVRTLQEIAEAEERRQTLKKLAAPGRQRREAMERADITAAASAAADAQREEERARAEAAARNFGRRVLGLLVERERIAVVGALIIAAALWRGGWWALLYSPVLAAAGIALCYFIVLGAERWAAAHERAWVAQLPFLVGGYEELLGMEWKDSGRRSRPLPAVVVEVVLRQSPPLPGRELIAGLAMAADPRCAVREHAECRVVLVREVITIGRVSPWFRRLVKKTLVPLHANHPIEAVWFDRRY